MSEPTDPGTRDDGPPTCCGGTVLPPIDEPAAEHLAVGFAAMADPVRLRILSMVATAGEICSCDLVEPLGKSQPTVSHHTKILSDAGLIRGDKRGRWVWWSVVPERMDALRAAMADHALAGHR